MERKKYEKDYQEEHQEDLKKYQKDYQKEHQEELKEYQKKYKKEHQEEIKKYQEDYQKEHYKKERKRYLLKEFESDTGFELICCHCNQFKSRSVCKKVSRLSTDLQDKHIIKDESLNMSKYGKYYVGRSCFEQIKSGKAVCV